MQSKQFRKLQTRFEHNTEPFLPLLFRYTIQYWSFSSEMRASNKFGDKVANSPMRHNGFLSDFDPASFWIHLVRQSTTLDKVVADYPHRNGFITEIIEAVVANEQPQCSHGRRYVWTLLIIL